MVGKKIAIITPLLTSGGMEKIAAQDLFYDPEMIVSIYSQMGVFIASRVHSSIFALAGVFLL